MTHVLITGGGGFVGQWLARTLLEKGDDVTLAGLGSLADGPAVLSAEERAAVNWVRCDMVSQSDVDAMVDASRADTVIHLAGIAFQPDADRNPAKSYDINALGAARLLASLARGKEAGTIDPSVLIVGSAMQYGSHPEREMPLTEAAEQRPLSVYAASKAAQEVVSLYAARATGLRVICTRSFNHSGVGHGESYLLPSLVRRVRGLARDASAILPLGNDVVRDYLHVRDVVTAYLALAERGISGEAYNVASGVGTSVRHLAELVLLRAGVRAEISPDASLVRSNDIAVLVGSAAKLHRDTGWVPTRTPTDIIDDLIHAAPH
jgi:GDP-4-dehydro-6-deoxy-D-mannose reductase